MKVINVKPTAKVAVQKSILRVYTVDDLSTVYLKDGTEFQIELFNPLQDTILCKFKSNGKPLNGEGLILYPGQRVFLERYLDNNKKLKFETYKVEDTSEVNGAIAKNGLIEVEFFKEQQAITIQQIPVYDYCSTTNLYNTGTVPNTFYCNSTINTVGLGNVTTISNSANNTLTFTASSGTIDLASTQPKRGFSKSLSKSSMDNWMDVEMDYSLDLKEKETGRIGQGSKSNQQFTYLDMNFQPSYFHKVSMKILPESEKIFDDKDLKHRQYCPECGKKINHKDKFCSFCGAKL